MYCVLTLERLKSVVFAHDKLCGADGNGPCQQVTPSMVLPKMQLAAQAGKTDRQSITATKTAQRGISTGKFIRY